MTLTNKKPNDTVILTKNYYEKAIQDLSEAIEIKQKERLFFGKNPSRDAPLK